MALAIKADTLAGPVLMDARKAMYLPEHGALLLGDIHFEKASFLQAVGHHPLPTFDTHDNLLRFETLMQDYAPRTVVALGDSFHDIRAHERFLPEHESHLNAITDTTDMVWVLGNHDPDIPPGVRGRREDHITLGNFVLTHHPHSFDGQVNVCGHLHPKAQLRVRGRKVTGPCFAVCPERIVVPSFGAYTGGLFVDDPAFARETGTDHRACRFYVIAAGHIAPVAMQRIGSLGRSPAAKTRFAHDRVGKG